MARLVQGLAAAAARAVLRGMACLLAAVAVVVLGWAVANPQQVPGRQEAGR